MKRTQHTLCLLAGCVILGCASLPRPPLLAQAEEQESNAALQRAAQLAPQSFAHARRLRERADDALANDNLSAATILAEHALAAQQHTLIQARIAAAEQRVAAAKARIAQQDRTLMALSTEQRALEVEAKALEVRLRVSRDAEPIVAVQPASPKREAARRKAAHSIIEGARLLCLASRMLDPKLDALPKLNKQILALETKIDGLASPTPIAEARSVRSSCLQTLTLVRRAVPKSQPIASNASQVDALLKQLAAALPNNPPSRDDRGIIVPIPSLTSNPQPIALPSALMSLAKVSQAHPQMPLMLVLHSRKPLAAPLKSRIKAQLQTAGLKPTIHYSSAPWPSGAAAIKGTRGASDWAELVFVAP